MTAPIAVGANGAADDAALVDPALTGNPANAFSTAVATQSAGLAADPYSKFVSDTADTIDVVDHVAYSLYKRDKLSFIEARKFATGSDPSDAEMDLYLCASTLPTRVEAYRTEASSILQGFSEAVLRTAGAEAEERHRAHFHDELKKVRPFWRNMVENMFANMAALALTALVVIAIYGTRISAVSLLGDIFGYDIKERPTQQLTVQPGAQAPAVK